MDGRGQQQFPTPKIRERKSRNLFIFSNGTPLGRAFSKNENNIGTRKTV
jgi:hypothetical protein